MRAQRKLRPDEPGASSERRGGRCDWGDSGVRRGSWKSVAETGTKTQRENSEK